MRPAESRGAASPAATPVPPAPELDRIIGLLLRRAYLAQRRGRLEQATRLVRQALQEAPDNVPALTLLAELLRAAGDPVGAIEAAQQATQAAAAHGAPPGSLRRAREERAAVEQEAVRQISDTHSTPGDAALTLLGGSGREWYHSAPCYLSLAFLGFLSLLLALTFLFRGATFAYLWFAGSLLAAGWCYHDAETHHQAGLFWGPVALCLGPFGLAIYLLARS